MKLSILIATQGRRNPKFRHLLRKLMKQVNKHKGEIEVVAYWNNGELPIGVIRQELVQNANGEYVCFIDDDDDIPDYYCDEIIKALGRDYVGFEARIFTNGIQQKPAYHSLKYNVWTEDDKGYYRGVTHLNPILREIALKGTFTGLGIGEDADWARSIRHLPLDEKYIDKVMYYYYHDMHDSSFGGEELPKGNYHRPQINRPYFRYHPDSKKASRESD